MAKIIIIPARYNSGRLRYKLLADVADKPLIYWTYQQAIKAGFDRVIIATDSEKISRACAKFGAEVALTSVNIQSGTERVASVVVKDNFSAGDIIVNLQGDEPLMPAVLINQVAINLSKSDNLVATLCAPITSKDEYEDENCVKVVFNNQQQALYFSRAPIPYFRDDEFNKNLCYRHLGLYAYRLSFLKQYQNISHKGYEQAEKLEQLSILQAGFNIGVDIAKVDTRISINTSADLAKLRQLL